MEQRDYLMQQIEQLGQVLAQMLAFLLGIKNGNRAGLSVDAIRQTYRDELDLSLELILETPADHIIDVLCSNVKYMDKHLEKMGDILKETAELHMELGDQKLALNLSEKALVIYKHIQASGNDYSMARDQKIKQLSKHLL